MIYNRIEDIIGDTPLLRLNAADYGVQHVDIYVKLEYLNPFGSIKDRTAKYLVQNIDFAELRHNKAKLIESSSGNTAKALQMIAHREGVGFTSVTNRIKIPEVEDVLRYLGTDIVSLPGRSECPDPNDSDNAVATIDRMVSAEPEKYHHTSQYTNLDNPKAHQETTAKELYADLETIDYIVTGVGTGGSSGGMLEYIKEHDLPTKCIGVVAHPSDFLPGIRAKNELFETPLFQEKWFTDITEVTTAAALEALDLLVRCEGVLAGPTTGANFAAALEWLKVHDTLREDGSRKTLVLIACDRLEPYMSYLKKRLPERFGLTSRNDVYQLSETSEAPEITATELAEKLASPTPPLVIDTRGVKAYGLFHIAGSLCYPEQLLQELFEDGAPFAADEVVFVCPKGDRSKLYAGLLQQRRVTAYSLKDGLMEWRQSGQPLERAKVGN